MNDATAKNRSNHTPPGGADLDGMIEFIRRNLAGSTALVAWPADITRNNPLRVAVFDIPRHLDQARLWLAERQFYNLGYVLNPVVPKPTGSGGAIVKDDVTAYRGIVQDIDRQEGETREAAAARIDAKIAALKAALPPSAGVGTGNGAQLAWYFHDVTPPATRGRVEAAAKALGAKLGGDAVASTQHFFRLPGSRNLPNAAKRSRGWDASMARLLFDDGPRHTLADIEAFAPPDPEVPGDAAGGDDLAEAMDVVGDPDLLPRALRDRIAADPQLTDLIRRADWSDDRSASDFAIACRCKEIHLSRLEAAMTVAACGSPGIAHDASKVEERGLAYLRVTIDHAWRKAEDPLRFFDHEASARARGDALLDMVDASSFEGVPVPKREFLDDREFIPMKYLTMLTGAGGTGKTQVALQLCVATVSGRPWLGAPLRRRGPAIIYSAEEDTEEIHIRLAAICRAEGLTFADLAGLKIVDRTTGEAALLVTDPADRTALRPTPRLEQMERTVAALKPALVVIDNRGQAVRGNEIDRNVASQAINWLQVVGRRHRCAIVLLAHPSLIGISTSTGASGSTGWVNTGRGQLDLVRPGHRGKGKEDDEPGEDDDRRQLVNRKANYSRPNRVLELLWSGGLWIQCDTMMSNERRDEHAEAVFLKLLRERNAEKNYVSPREAAHSTYAPKVFNRHPRGERIGIKRFTKAMDSLKIRGVIKVVSYGGSKDYTRLEIVE